MLPLAIFSVEIVSEYLLLLASILVFAAIMISKAGAKFGAPSLLLFLLLGLLVGGDGLGIVFEDYHIAETIGHFAMTIILFTAGLKMTREEAQPIFKQGVLLSTVGVLLFMLLTGLFIFLFAGKYISGIESSIIGSFLIAAIISSTDSTSVFSILRGKRINLRENLSPMLELESSSNDPMAYILTIIMVQLITGERAADVGAWGKVFTGAGIFVLQVVVGVAVGMAGGYLSKWLLSKIKLPNGALYSILVLSMGFFANGLAGVLHGNGLLALYITAVHIGNCKDLPHKADVHKFFDAISWLMQLMMFLMLGLLARPSTMLGEIGPALLIALFAMFLARPASVFICLAPFKQVSFKGKLLVSWVGLKGAGPILFALCPVVAGIDASSDIFNIVFLITLLSLLMQGMTLPPVARKLDLCYEEDPEVETFGLELPEEMGMMRDHVVTADDLAGGNTVREMHLPHGIRIVMVKRDGRFLVPHGSMELFEGDHLVIIMGESDD